MYWLLLVLSILFEVAGTTSMKLSEGFTKLIPSAIIFVCYGCSFILFAFVLKRLDVSLAYAVWAGVGTALAAVVGVLYFMERLTVVQLASIALIVLGVVGLKLGTRAETAA